MIDVHIDGIVFAEVPLGGISRMWQNIINRLPGHGCRVHLYMPQTADRNIKFDNAVNIIDYPRQYRFRPGRIFNPLTERYYRKCIDQMWSRPRSGIFHSTHFTTNTNLRIPQVVTVHDLFHECLPDCFTESQRHPFCNRRKKSVEAADVLVCDSQATLHDVEKVYKGLTQPSKVVWLAVDPIFRKMRPGELANPELPQKTGKPFLLYVGTRFPYKNFTGLLAGYAAWRQRNDYKLLVLGERATAAELGQIRAFGLGNNVVFESASDRELAVAYNRASAVIVPSLSEGFGLPVWEAMACGTPVVSSRGGSLPEVGGDIPVYFDFGAPQKMADAFEEAVSISKESDRIACGRERATARTWDNVAQEYVETYRELASRSL